MTQTIQAAKEEREVMRSREAVKVVLLNPAALEDCDAQNQLTALAPKTSLN